jgi:hypothetical protein
MSGFKELAFQRREDVGYRSIIDENIQELTYRSTCLLTRWRPAINSHHYHQVDTIYFNPLCNYIITVMFDFFYV